ncbi:MAG: CsbD family protein [Acidobacteriota bacterium]|nr:CsbD family protein [Acidobacteriota bacterium]
MNWDRLETNWEQIAIKAHERWSKLTDDDLQMAAGRRDALVSRIQARYAIPGEEAMRQADEWIGTLPGEQRAMPDVPKTRTAGGR